MDALLSDKALNCLLQAFPASLSLWVSQSFGYSSPFCPLYLLTAGLLILAWLMWEEEKTWRESWLHLRNLWNSQKRAMAADGLWALGHMICLKGPLALLHVLFFQGAYTRSLSFSSELLAPSWQWTAPVWLQGFLATLVTMLAIDFVAYVIHRAMHTVPCLWHVHRLHHSATFLTPLTTLRQHPLEPLMLSVGRGVAAGCGLGFLHAWFSGATPLWTLGGMGCGFFFYMFTVNLHHAPIPLRYPAVVSLYFLSPHMHHLHHSRALHHHGSNFGVVFSIWDRLFGSYLDQRVGLDELEFGQT